MLNINEIMELSFVEKMVVAAAAIKNPEGYLQVTKYGYGRLEVKKVRMSSIMGWDVLYGLRGIKYTDEGNRDIIEFCQGNTHWKLIGRTEGYNGSSWVSCEPYAVEHLMYVGFQGEMGYVPYGKGYNSFYIQGKELETVPVTEEEVMDNVKRIRLYNPDIAWIVGEGEGISEVFTGFELYVKKDRWLKIS